MEIIERGTEITFRATFKDANGITTVPPSADLWIYYRPVGTKTYVSAGPMGMTLEGDTYITSWNTGLSDPGMVHGYALSSGDEPVGVDFCFTVSRNPAVPA